MGRRAMVALAIASVIGLSAAHASTVDSTSPRSRIRTETGSILFFVPYAKQDRIGGTATDTGSGIASIRVRYTNTRTGLVSTTIADIGCESPTRLSCAWVALPPIVPGTYEATVAATDRAGNAETPNATIDIIVL